MPRAAVLGFVFRSLSVSLLLLIAPPLSAEPPCIPDFVQAYFKNTGLGYERPQGQFEPYLSAYFDEQKQSEPWAVAADFNGDDIKDWAGLVRSDAGKMDLIAVLSSGGEYSHYLLATPGTDDDRIYFGVMLEPAGIIEGISLDEDVPDPRITLENPGVHLVYFEKSSVLYYFRNDDFHKLWTSD